MNILRYKQKAINHHPCGEDDGSTDARGGYGSYSTPDTSGSWNGSEQSSDGSDQHFYNQVAGTDTGPSMNGSVQGLAVSKAGQDINTYGTASPSLWDRLGIFMPGTSQAQNFMNNETQEQRDDRMGLVLNTAANTLAYSNPFTSTVATLGNIYNKYDSNKSVTDNLASIFNPGQLTTLAAKALGVPTQVASYAGLGANVATSKDPLATAASFLNGQVGNKIGSYTGINMSPFTSRVATAGLNSIFNSTRKSL
jgi:hypothetical protein